MDELTFPHDMLQSLQDLLAAGYTSSGINYGCGCTRSAWFKDHKLVEEYNTRCEAHASSNDWPPLEVS